MSQKLSAFFVLNQVAMIIPYIEKKQKKNWVLMLKNQQRNYTM